ncbi:MAG: hypothetical protein JKY19_11260 [Alcanivoracaceae bacterium]|nr:hypothetical protein [Alcanivoracaceae bacterium]
MKKIYIIIIMFSVNLTAFSHTFITEILVNSNTTINESNSEFITIENYSFNEDEILIASDEQIYNDHDHDNLLLKERIKLETLKQIIPSQTSAKTIDCDDENINLEVSETCGQFDHFNAARTAATKTCYFLANQNPQLYTGPVVPRFTGPSTFIIAGTAIADHHTIYDIADGLSFSCVEVVISND